MPVSTFENLCLEGKLTFGDPFLDSGMAGPPSGVNLITALCSVLSYAMPQGDTECQN